MGLEYSIVRDVPWRRSQFNVSFSLVCVCVCFMFQIGCFDLSFLLLRPSALCSHLFRFSVNKHDDDDDMQRKRCMWRCTGGNEAILHQPK